MQVNLQANFRAGRVSPDLQARGLALAPTQLARPRIAMAPAVHSPGHAIPIQYGAVNRALVF